MLCGYHGSGAIAASLMLVNVDGSARGSPGLSAAGGILRDAEALKGVG